jgi:predicted nucleic acid-binding protein
VEAVFKADLRRRHGSKHWARMRHDGRARRPTTRLIREVILAWNAVLHALDFVIIELNEVAPDVPGLMSSYGLGSNDAVHTATALKVRVKSMVTLDAGFAAVPEASLQIYTDRSRLRDCRRFRQ